MNDPEILQLMKETAAELRALRLEVLRLQNVVMDRNIKGRFLNMVEACDYLKIKRSTMQRRIADGSITFAVKKGKAYLFPEEKLKAYASGMA